MNAAALSEWGGCLSLSIQDAGISQLDPRTDSLPHHHPTSLGPQTAATLQSSGSRIPAHTEAPHKPMSDFKAKGKDNK